MSDRKTSANHNASWQRPQRGWITKFCDAAKGIVQGVRGQSSFIVHLVATVAVVVAGVIVQVSLERWCLLVLCMGLVLAAELLNSSLEWICRSSTGEFDPDIQRALNISSGAVLLLSMAAAIVGASIFLSELF